MNVEHCGANVSEVAMLMRHNAVALSSRVSVAVLPLSISICWHHSSMVSVIAGHSTCSITETEWGRTIGTRGGSNSTRYKRPAKPAIPAVMYRPNICTIQTNSTLNTLLWAH